MESNVKYIILNVEIITLYTGRKQLFVENADFSPYFLTSGSYFI